MKIFLVILYIIVKKKKNHEYSKYARLKKQICKLWYIHLEDCASTESGNYKD